MNNDFEKEAEKINRECLTFPNAFMAKIENEISHINKRLDDIPTKSEMMLANEQLLVRALDKADVRYAGKNLEVEVKWIKSIVYGIGMLCCLYVINSLLDLI